MLRFRCGPVHGQRGTNYCHKHNMPHYRGLRDIALERGELQDGRDAAEPEERRVLYAWLYDVSSEVWLWASCIKLFLTEHDAQYGVRHTRRARCVQLSCFSVLIPIARGRGARRASAFAPIQAHPCSRPDRLFIAGYIRLGPPEYLSCTPV